MQELIRDFFTEEGWLFQQVGEETFHLSFSGSNAQWNCIVYALELEAQCVFYSTCPMVIAKNRYLTVAEFLMRINNILPVGNFDLDWDTGISRFKTSIDVEGDQLSKALFRQLAYTNVVLMDKYLPALMSVLYEEKPPVEAVEQIEKREESSES